MAAAASTAQAPSFKTLVVGLGKTGLSCARYLVRQGYQVAVTDSRDLPPALDQLRSELPYLALFLGGFRPEVFKSAGQLVVSPGVAVSHPLIQEAMTRGVPVLGDIELFARSARAPIAAITGSNGKSTVTSLLGLMARAAGLNAAVGGNLGSPALDLLDEVVELYVLELSSFQLETTDSLAARAACVLNLSPDHLDRYPSLETYAAAKARIYRHAETAVVNRDDPLVCRMATPAGSVRGFSLSAPRGEDFGLGEHQGRPWLMRGPTPLLPATEVALTGRHNLANALAALAMGDACGLPMPTMLECLRRFEGLPHRTRLVRQWRGVRWYDDSKGTNVGATIAALEGLHDPTGVGRAVLIAGGDAKGADFDALAPMVERTARAVVLIGRDAPRIEAALSGRVPLVFAGSLEQAVGVAAELALPGDHVLLSPACASFDMFRDYQHRGEVFAAAVRRLPE